MFYLKISKQITKLRVISLYEISAKPFFTNQIFKKMKKITFLIAIIALFIITGLGIYSCQKGQDNTIQDIQEGRTLTNEQIELIGEKHNEYLKIMLDNNHSAKDKFQGLLIQKQILEEKFLNKSQNIRLSAMYSKEYENNKTPKDHSENVRNNLSDKNNFAYFQRVIDFLKKEKNEKNIETISNFIDTIKNEMIKNNVNVKDYEAFLVFSSVLKKSAKFWLPKKMGGQNYYAFYKNNLKIMTYKMVSSQYSNSESSNNDGWKKCLEDILVADGMSASAGFIIGASVTVATGGVAGPGFVIGIALESGAASAWEYYDSSSC